jgi:predicted transcriptional regulator of viral defense system
MTTAISSTQRLFRQQGGLLGTADALRLGVTPRTLYAMRDSGDLIELSRGLYRLAELPPLSDPDLVTVALKIPKGVVCLISALAFHDLTTQIPHAVHVALPYSVKRPRLPYPPMTVYWISGPAFNTGVETHRIDGVDVKVYDPEKTVADCFKFRNRIGLDVTIEALKRCAGRKGFRPDKLIAYAGLNRVDRIMRPYLEMLQ